MKRNDKFVLEKIDNSIYLLPVGQMGVYSKALWNPYVLASLLSPPRLP